MKWRWCFFLFIIWCVRILRFCAIFSSFSVDFVRIWYVYKIALYRLVQNISFARQSIPFHSIPFSMFYFSTIFFFRLQCFSLFFFLLFFSLHRTFFSMLFFVLQLKIIIYAFSVANFYLQPIGSTTHNIAVSLQSDGIFYSQRDRFDWRYRECWWLVLWILNSENHFFMWPLLFGIFCCSCCCSCCCWVVY